MNLSNYVTSVKSSFEILRDTFYKNDLGYIKPLPHVPMEILKRGVNSVILARWIFPSRYHVPISHLEELKRLEVTERILEELF